MGAHGVRSRQSLAFQATFRSDTQLVQINVVVHDKNGPVPNLTKEDFVLTDAGKPRAIAVFSVVSARQPPGHAPALAENIFSNRRHGADATPPSHHRHSARPAEHAQRFRRLALRRERHLGRGPGAGQRPPAPDPFRGRPRPKRSRGHLQPRQVSHRAERLHRRPRAPSRRTRARSLCIHYQPRGRGAPRDPYSRARRFQPARRCRPAEPGGPRQSEP